jgi:mRNA-degrading endonuclease RelE of RelBE toxin-antitoxin system
MEYSLEFDEGWDHYFKKLDKSMKGRVWKKILQLKGPLPARHLKKGLDFYVSEIGQYRLCYKMDENRMAKTIYFVGDHKEYEKWLGI